MDKNILNTGIQNFISDNLNADIVSLLFQKPFFDIVSNKGLVEQIVSKKKCKKKLPKWFETPQVYYPKKLSIEQTSSERTARYKSEIISGKTLVDLTGGLGVDSYFFSLKLDAVFHCEIDAELTEIAAHNFKVFGVENVITIQGDGIQFLEKSTNRFDWIFIDPSRRDNLKGKVFHLSDCRPNVLEHLKLLFDKADNLLIKTAPFLDISSASKDLPNIRELHIIAVNNEVKELLWVLKKEYSGEIQVKTVNLTQSSAQTFNFSLSDENNTRASFSPPLTYLYEPNAAIMKSGAFKTIGNRYSVKKIHASTHLYTSKELLEFPGRRFLIKETIPYNKKASTYLKGLKANIATRNFPLAVAEIRKKHQIKEGGDTYLFFLKNLEEQRLILKCEKIV